MKNQNQTSWLVTVCSWVCLVLAAALLVGVCRSRWPQLEDAVRTALTGEALSPVRSAFHMLADGLEQGEPIRETFARSIELLHP